MIEDISVFCVIARHQSFSKAARELDISTPVITRRLARLEKQLGTRLLNRTTRQVVLTEAGRLFYDEANEILDLLEQSKENVKTLMTQVSGTIKVALPSGLNQHYVIPALNTFLTQHPHLKIHLVTGNQLLGLLNQNFDLVIQCGELPESRFFYKRLGTMKNVICASPNYIKQYGMPKTLEDLQKHNCLDFFNNFEQTWIMNENDHKKEILISGNVQVNSAVELLSLAMNGIGIIYLPFYLVNDAIRKGELVSILDQYQPNDYGLYAVYPSKKYLAKKTQVFLDFLITLLKPALSDSVVPRLDRGI